MWNIILYLAVLFLLFRIVFKPHVTPESDKEELLMAVSGGKVCPVILSGKKMELAVESPVARWLRRLFWYAVGFIITEGFFLTTKVLDPGLGLLISLFWPIAWSLCAAPFLVIGFLFKALFDFVEGIPGTGARSRQNS